MAVLEPVSDATLLLLLELLVDYDDPAIDHAVVSAVETALRRESRPYWLRDAFRLVFARFGDCQGSRVEHLGYDAAPRLFDRAWETARYELGIPEADSLRLGDDPVE